VPLVADLSRNLPPPTPTTDTAFRDTLQRLLARANFTGLTRTHRFMGTGQDRAQGAAWTARRLGTAPDPERVLLTNGTLSAMNMIFPAVLRPGDTLLTETLTYPAVLAIARQYGFRIVAVDSDEEGMSPEALARACREHRPKALYCLATLQNPTTTVMPLARRRDIVGVVRRYGLTIVEDDIYSLLAQSAPPPLAVLAPDVSWYVLGLGKSFTVGLRFAYVVAPTSEEARRAFWPGVRSTFWMAAPITAEIVGEWMSTELAGTLLHAVREEAAARHTLATAALSHLDFRSPPGAIHGWLRLPPGTRAAFHEALKPHNVLAGDAAPFVNNGKPVPDAARICFGSPESREELSRGVAVVAEVVPRLGAS
jgi:DNA-binding transcriptional MocR family regulator